jgi:hypothetical protein
VEHGEEIYHAYIVSPFACWRLYIPKTLHIFAGQGAIFFIVAVGKRKGSHGIGSCHTLGIIACRLCAIKVELTTVKSLVLEEL